MFMRTLVQRRVRKPVASGSDDGVLAYLAEWTACITNTPLSMVSTTRNPDSPFRQTLRAFLNKMYVYS
jgi:hypothetical protein